MMASSGLVLCFAILAGGKGAVPTVSTLKKPATPAVSPPTPTVKAPTTPTPTVRPPKTPHHAFVAPVQAPTQMLSPGATGSQVVILQKALAALGFSARTTDGDYGPATQTAVARFQASKGLPQVGTVGPQTLVALRQALARRSPR